MTAEGFVDFENLKQYDEQLKNYINEKIAEAIKIKEQESDSSTTDENN